MAATVEPIPCDIPETMPQFDAQRIINITLKPHQIMNIIRANKLENYEDINIPNTSYSIKSKVGVMCDKVGAGKTLTMLGLIGHKPFVPSPEIYNFKNSLNGGWGSCSGDRHNPIISRIIGEASYKENCETTTLPLNIIVVPHTIFKQWENTIKTHTTIPYYSIKNKKTHDKFWEDTSLEELKHGKYNIILVTNKFYRIFSEHGFGNHISVSRVIYDEVDTINIPRNGKIISSFYWGMTATYEDIINGSFYNYGTKFPNAGFVRELFQSFRHFWCGTQSAIQVSDRKNIVTELFIRNSNSFIESSFNLPEMVFNIHPCDAPPMISVLDGVVSSGVMMLLNAGDVGAAIEAVSCVKVDTQVSLIEVVTGEFQKELHNANIAYKAALEYHYSSNSARDKSLEKHQEEITKLESKISNLRERIEQSSMCPVCCDEIDNTTITRCCNNSFCFECITKSIDMMKSCPVCRAKINQDDLIVMTDSGGGTKDDDECNEEKKRVDKSDAFGNIVKKNIEWTNETGVVCKYLVYSESYHTFYEVRETLLNNSISSCVIKGSIGAISNNISKYRENSNELQALMVNSKYAASGMNLENTTDVVIWHTMSKAKITQIIGRAQRPGRTMPLRVHFLAHPNELKDFEEYYN